MPNAFDQFDKPRSQPGILARRDPDKDAANRRADIGTNIDAARLGLSQAQFQAQLQQQAQQFQMQMMQMNKPPEGFQRNAAGTGFEFIPGGPADPAVIAARAAAAKDGVTAPKTDAEKDAIRAEAIDKIKLARSLIERSKKGWFTTGLGAGVAGSIGGTGAYGVKKDTETLQNAGALTRVMEMSAANGGKNPLTPLSNSDFQALSSSLTNLDPSQDDAQYQANVQKVIDLYQRAYGAAGGTDLEGDIDPANRKQPLPGAMPSAGGGVGGSPRGYENDPSGNRSFITERDRAYQAEVSEAFKRGADRSQMDAIAAKYGAGPFGPELDQAIQTRAVNPAAPVGFTTPASGREEAGLTGSVLGSLAGGGLGSYAIGAGNAVTAGQLGNIAELTGSSQGGTDVAMDMAQQNALPYFAGSLTGDTLGSLALGSGFGKLASLPANPIAAGILRNPLTSDATFGALTGAGNADDPLYGAVGGGLLGAAGSYGGSKIGSGLFGLRTPKGLDRLNPGERSVMTAINKTGPDVVQNALQNAINLNVPASLADVSPEVNSLTGAAIRRSPSVAGMARDTLMKRSGEQIDRFGQSIERNLGPLDNVLERSDQITQRAQDNAAPLYQEAYAAPVVSTPRIEQLLSTPFGRQGLGYAEKIAANEGRNTKAMGFALDEAGNPVLNPIPEQALGVLGAAESKAFAAEQALRRAETAQLTGAGGPNVNEARAAHQQALTELEAAQTAMNAQPSVDSLAASPGYTTQTIDYAKRGMDKVLEQYRNPVTGKLVLDDLGKSENKVLRALLQEADTVNPAFGQARAAYAGPAAEREALFAGQDAWGQTPEALAVLAGRQTPERLEQMQLGSRGALMKAANDYRTSTNPFGMLNSRGFEQRLGSLYPENPGVADLLAQRDLELQMAGSTNRLIGNSATAERQAADQAFDDGASLPRALAEGAAETAITGAPVMTIARRLGLQGAKDVFSMGVGKKAAQRAEQIGPIALNTDPQATIAQILAMAQRATDYDAAKAALKQTGKRPGSIAGTSVAAALIPFLTGGQ